MYVEGGASTQSLAEMRQMMTDRFQKTDTDGSGGVTLDEMIQASGQNSPTGKNGPSVEEIFGQMDTDGSGDVSQVEMEAFKPSVPPMDSGTASALLGAQEDSSSFSSQSLEELGTGTTETSTAASASGGGGQVTSTTEETYDELDTNEDGVVSQSEREAGLVTSLLSSSGNTVSSSDDEDETVQDALLQALEESDEEESNTSASSPKQDNQAINSSIQRMLQAYGNSQSSQVSGTAGLFV
ncbi:MAG: EF-hand domain-containing protein [Rhodospirillum sp.]|nr:EF-hand domain-containing protein [Rhodospirillum sp.]MCF8489375.1 EF-hand domain-containing protein [Rhodospirillum sp.]MCF8501725.1 EF-hand domain-containing protein [Rhodospirillum sp.]